MFLSRTFECVHSVYSLNCFNIKQTRTYHYGDEICDCDNILIYTSFVLQCFVIEVQQSSSYEFYF